jgi:hypothetical protein
VQLYTYHDTLNEKSVNPFVVPAAPVAQSEHAAAAALLTNAKALTIRRQGWKLTFTREIPRRYQSMRLAPVLFKVVSSEQQTHALEQYRRVWPATSTKSALLYAC